MTDLGNRVGRGHIGNGVVVLGITDKARDNGIGTDIPDDTGVGYVAYSNTLGECAHDGGCHFSARVGEISVNKGDTRHIVGSLCDSIGRGHIGYILVVGIAHKRCHNRIRTYIFDDTGCLVADGNTIR